MEELHAESETRASTHDVPIHAWLLYKMRFLLTDELLRDLSTFGGLCASLIHLSIVLNIATADSADVSLVYDRLVNQQLEEAMARAETAIGSGYFDNFTPRQARTLPPGCRLLRSVLRDQTRPRSRLPRRTSRLIARREIMLIRGVAITADLDPIGRSAPASSPFSGPCPDPPPSIAHTAPEIAP